MSTNRTKNEVLKELTLQEAFDLLSDKVENLDQDKLGYKEKLDEAQLEIDDLRREVRSLERDVENYQDRIMDLEQALRDITEDARVLSIVHPNPLVREFVKR